MSEHIVVRYNRDYFQVSLADDGSVTDVKYDADLLSIMDKLNPETIETFKQLAHEKSELTYE
jgi:hypothetical protein